VNDVLCVLGQVPLTALLRDVGFLQLNFSYKSNYAFNTVPTKRTAHFNRISTWFKESTKEILCLLYRSNNTWCSAICKNL